MAIDRFDGEFEGQLERALGKVYCGCAGVGECFVTADRIEDGDYDSRYDEWFATAERVEDVARDARDRRHRVSAREAFLRSMEYYSVHLACTGYEFRRFPNHVARTPSRTTSHRLLHGLRDTDVFSDHVTLTSSRTT